MVTTIKSHDWENHFKALLIENGPEVIKGTDTDTNVISPSRLTVEEIGEVCKILENQIPPGRGDMPRKLFKHGTNKNIWKKLIIINPKIFQYE